LNSALRHLGKKRIRRALGATKFVSFPMKWSAKSTRTDRPLAFPVTRARHLRLHTAPDIAIWLRQLGLGRYEAAFRENDIDQTVLRSLTHETLKELGVASLGHRLRLLDAIAAPGSDAGVEPPAVTTEIVQLLGGTPTVASITDAVGERRHLTVMFCDLAGSTSISATLDAEDWRDLVGAYLDTASTAVIEMGGHVANKMGDGLMALFGYPVAQENDTERAARAALSVLRGLTELNRKNEGTGKPILNVRIGIETGPVVVDAAGEIYGDAPNVASRVQALAEPGTVVVTAEVQRRIVGLFVAEERGSHELKGLPERVTLFRLVRASGGGRHVGQRHFTPLVGRDEEIAMLMRRWERARQGEGQFVTIVGEPGIGKSRLIAEFRARLAETPHTWGEWTCSQLLRNTPLHPISDWGRQRFGGVGRFPAEQFADLENTLALLKLDPMENAPLLAPLLEIPVPQERASTLAPDDLRRRQLESLTKWLVAGAQAHPSVLVLEDLHWADPTTLDLLRGIADRSAPTPGFFLITARPEFQPPWGIRPHHCTISVAPLDRAQVRHMVGKLAAGHAPPNEVVDGLTERTGGVPLFVEELTRFWLERGERDDVQVIPPTLQQSLTARLDRLGPAREVAQIGAVIGRNFSYQLIRAVAGIEDAPLRRALDRLADADILLVQGRPPDADYRFKHALIQDAAYENLLRSRRQSLHRNVAESLRDKFRRTAAAEPEALAHHFTQAAVPESAIEWWGRAGRRSLERSAFIEAVEQFKRALALITTLPSTPALRLTQIQFQAALITPLVHVRGYAASETKAAAEQARLLIEQAEALGEPLEDKLLLFSVLYGVFVPTHAAFSRDVCCNLAAHVLTLAEKQRASFPLVLGHNFLGSALLLAGEFSEARAHLDQAIALYDPVKHRPLAPRFGEDQRIINLAYFRSTALWVLGYPEAALADIDQAYDEARQSGQAAFLGLALIGSFFVVDTYCGNYAKANVRIDELIALADEKGAGWWKAWAMLGRGWLLGLTGKAADAVEVLTSGIAAWRLTGATQYLPRWLSYLAEARADLGQLDEAWRCIDEAARAIDTTKERWFEAETYRIAGEIALKSPAPDVAKAETYFKRALVVAHQQQARAWELRAAMSLARLWRDQGKPQQAHELLAPVYNWFTEGFDTLDLKEAKTLLDELAA
jgi:class 3 adenylate cyclase/predicted ATPase